MSANEENINANICVVCYKNVEIYSIGMCEHPVCYECSTRMRVLCQQNECPICRQDLPKVVFTREIKPFRYLRKGDLLDTNYDIYFDSSDIQEKFYDLLANACTICEDRKVFPHFRDLRNHMKLQHELHYCHLCVENLKIFSRERRCYTRSELVQHRRKGDIDDRSHKGHPLCEFCDKRYMDNDELYRHLRRDHLYCHFCDADGLHQYYSSYEYLRDHFRQEHFLCEEGTCAEEKFTSVFRTDIDLKAHKTSVHGKQLSKAAAKQARTLELEFTLAPRGDGRANRRTAIGASTSKGVRDYQPTTTTTSLSGTSATTTAEVSATVRPGSPSNFHSSTETASYFASPPTPPSLDVQSTEEFPTLGNCTFVPTLSQSKGRGNLTIRSTVRPQSLAVTDENFPALGPESSNAGLSKTVNVSVSSGSTVTSSVQSQCKKGSSSNVSIQVNRELNGTVTTRVSGPNIRVRPAQLSVDSDFPVLGQPSVSVPSSSAQWKEVLQWTCTNSAKSKKMANSLPPAPPSAATASPSPTVPSGDDFPCLSKFTKQSKQSAITVLPSWGQSQASSSSSANSKTTVELTKSKNKKKKSKHNSVIANETNHTKSNNVTCDAKKKEESHVSCDTNDVTSTATVDVAAASSVENCTSKNVKITGTEMKPNGQLERNNGNKKESKETEQANKKEKRKNKNAEEDSCVAAGKSSVSGNGSGSGSGGSGGGGGGGGNPPKHNAQRKRTELKINSVNSSNKDAYKVEDFPPLGGSGSRPPGFVEPPPGFKSFTATASPPPGFCVKVENTKSLAGNNSLTFTNSSGESYAILPDSTSKQQTSLYSYVLPPDFQKRNKSLVAKVNDVLTEQDRIEEFRYMSGLFRQGVYGAEEYYSQCLKVMGKTAFENVFPELIVLLPDIAKQQELYQVYRKQMGDSMKGLEICATCGQILKSGSDLKTHMTSHTLENHFPALGKHNPMSNRNVWLRK